MAALPTPGSTSDPDYTQPCLKCDGTGNYDPPFMGDPTCFCCEGKGTRTRADQARCRAYDAKHPGKRETYLSEDEARALVEAPRPDFKPFLVCALATGMRKGEIQRLRWGSVDRERRFLVVEPQHNKTGKARAVPLSSWLEEALATFAPSDMKGHANELVFRTANGVPMMDWELRKRLDEALGRCTVIDDVKKPKVTMHVMRHTAASLMVAAGVPIYDVAKILGHSTVQVTMRYAHFAPQAGRAAIDALDRALRSKPVTGDHVAERTVELATRPRRRSGPPGLPRGPRVGSPREASWGQDGLGRTRLST